MGLTREQISARRKADSERVVKYNATMKPHWTKLEEEWLERARAMEMLLGAIYNRHKNIFIMPGEDGTSDRWFDCKGVELTDDDEIFTQAFRRPW